MGQALVESGNILRRVTLISESNVLDTTYFYYLYLGHVVSFI